MRRTEDGSIIAKGRHRGRTISEIKNLDESYLQWLVSPSGPLNQEAIDTLQAEKS